MLSDLLDELYQKTLKREIAWHSVYGDEHCTLIDLLLGGNTFTYETNINGDRISFSKGWNANDYEHYSWFGVSVNKTWYDAGFFDRRKIYKLRRLIRGRNIFEVETQKKNEIVKVLSSMKGK